MKTLIIYAHPYEHSFNHAILEKTISSLKSEGTEFSVIDLYAEEFNPSYSAEELRLFSSGRTQDPLVEKYQKMIKNASNLIFIFPIWWSDLPAILKGFVDKVFKKDFAYTESSSGLLKGKLSHIRSTKVITTSTSPTWFIRFFAGNAIKSVFIKTTLKQVGIKNVKWINFGQINQSTEEKRQNFLNNLKV